MEQDLNFIRQQTESRLKKRRNILIKQYEKFPDEKIPEKVILELQSIQKLLNEVSIEDIPKQISLKMSDLEKWYFALMLDWIIDHPDAINAARFSRAEIYKFTMHFFVDNIILNSKNQNLSFGTLKNKVSKISEESELEKNILQQLKEIKDVTTYGASLNHVVADMSSEYPNGISELLKNNQENDLSDNSFSNSLKEFIEKRNFEKQNTTNKNNQLGFNR